MQSSFTSSRILLPVRPWFIFFSLFVALLLNLLPTARWPAMPDWVALTLCFWSLREFRRVGMGWSFLFGVLMDVADGSLMGQHALAYVLLSYGATSLSRRILWFPLGQQALQIFPLLMLVQLIQVGARMMAGAAFPGLGYLMGPFLAAALWVPATYILLLPQYQPVERDENRPI
ncbi:rod shape-determining protein MreD [Azospira inquinata]|uniref:Rod shape-determining protein MreD n=1 Tax=Azospira inquinata TaxID=2785627 RepID=A0A975SPS6_9RHOO|nr:rod shape-determining protein MreD [Azospira inquinata]QWT47157.1 rod shape-determining protein MreD [Azospira inquinata]QWT50213.1 rod shape-determining protein MreD [Azospira inquinata]